jgi:MFS family permease
MESFPTKSNDGEPQTPSLTEDPALGLSRRAKMEILGAVMLGMFLSALDQTIVGPVLPKIVSDLNGIDFYTWAVTIYLLTSTVTVPIYGKLSDLYGRKPILMIGIGFFLAGSALSGLSQEMWQLVLFRGIRWRSSATSSPRPSAASTRASSGSSSAPRSSRGRRSAASSPTPSAGTRSSTSTSRSARWRWRSSGTSCRTSSTSSGRARSTTSA